MKSGIINACATAMGLAGMFVCLATVMLRLAGYYYVIGVPVSTVFIGGIALIVSGCFLKLHLITGNRNENGSNLRG